ncbi:MAG: nucleotidyltransferase domain-containing protein [bacterium]|nr:nucleotidyltransferase domain-containing protein [bacterium]
MPEAKVRTTIAIAENLLDAVDAAVGVAAGRAAPRPDGELQPIPDQVKQVVRGVERDAEVILYGSRSRGDARSDSDWDFLILVNGPVDDEREDAIRHRIYEIEWASGEVLCSVICDREEWDSPRYRAMPFHQSVDREGMIL